MKEMKITETGDIALEISFVGHSNYRDKTERARRIQAENKLPEGWAWRQMNFPSTSARCIVVRADGTVLVRAELPELIEAARRMGETALAEKLATL